MEKRWDVLGLGCVTVDDLLYVEEFPEPDRKAPVSRYERQCGGLTATALVAAARLGAKCAYGGLMGEGPFARMVEETLAREGVDLSPAVRRDDAEPIHATIVVDTTRHTRTIFYRKDGRIGADDELPDAETLRATRVLFIDHYGSMGNIRAAKIAREAGIPVVADFERSNVPRFEEMLPLVDHLIVSRDFALRYTGEEAIEAALLRLQEITEGTVVVTRGGEGCIYSEAPGGKEPAAYPAFAVPVADTTGCGDVFHGAYAFALARGIELPERIRLASAAAAIKATRHGGQAGIPGLAEVERFLCGNI